MDLGFLLRTGCDLGMGVQKMTGQRDAGRGCMTFYDLTLRAADCQFHDLLLVVAVKMQIQGWGHGSNLLVERSVKNFVIIFN